jgi:2,4-diaminopentanoate dehydrogenase
MSYRVVHCGTGNIGREALAGIIHHPDLELVGHYVWSRDKVGVDSGILAGTEPTTVRATDNWDELLDLEAEASANVE